MSGTRISEEAVARDREQSRLRATAYRAANREQYNLEMRKYEAEHGERINGQRRMRYGADMAELASRPFIGWDGEGYTDENNKHHYMLFGCSMYPDKPIIGRSLTTKECLDYILYVESRHSDSFHVGFAFDYDVNMILGDLEARFLRHLAVYGVVHWQKYRIQYVPGKFFRVSYGRDDERVTATIYDVFGFFHTSYVKSLLKFGITTEAKIARIEVGKKKRGTFTFSDIEYVKLYWQDEISLFPMLADCIREACYDAGLFITQWHGPGALASYMITKRGVRKWHSRDVPIEVKLAIPIAYAGGRFTPWRCGLWYHDIYTADINSAYIYACSLLPRLDNGRWIRQRPVDREHIARFGLYHIAYDAGKRKLAKAREDQTIAPINPLFNRGPRGVCWPARTEGWYWSPEAELVKNDRDATFIEAWIYESDGSYPFSWVADVFDQRLLLQQQDNPAEKTLKWALAAMYGAFAQTIGWDQKNRLPPRNHELAWAGFITSWCRAEMYRLGYECWKQNALISIDTDGVTSSIPFEDEWLDRGIGDRLGQWKLEKFHGILYWQTGLFWMLDGDGNWTTAKTRGFKRGSLDVEAAFKAMESDRRPVIEKFGTRFIGFRDALNRNAMKEWKQWKEIKQEAKMGRGSTYFHNREFCPKCKDPERDSMHYLMHIPTSRSVLSEPRPLPWLQEQPSLPEIKLDVDLDIIPHSEIADNL